MKTTLAALLACADCHGTLALHASTWEGEECMTGQLHCESCGKAWPVVRGVPRFVRADALDAGRAATADNFGWQWTHFTQEDERYAEQFLGWMHPARPEAFAGRVVLDAGCGKGRHTAVVAGWGARAVVGVDLSAAVDTAFARTRGLANAHVVQADLYRLPFRPVFDHAFAVGVLHHAPDPGAAFRALAATVAPGGVMSAWVYGAENNAWITRVVNPLRERITSKMSPRVLLYASTVPTAALFAATRLVYGPLNTWVPSLGRWLFYNDYLAWLARFGWTEHHTIVFDHLVAPTAHYIARSEFAAWWRDVGATDVSITWHHRNSWTGHGRPGFPFPDSPAEP